MEMILDEKKIREEALQIEQDLLKLFEHPGWVHIRGHIEGEIESKIEQLVIEKNQDEISRLQAEIKAYREVPKFIAEAMHAADSVRELKLEETLFIPDLN